MSASLIRFGTCAVLLAAGLTAPGIAAAAERPSLQSGTVAPLATTGPTGQGNSVSVSDMTVAADKPIFLIVGAERTNENAGAATIFGRVDGTIKKIKTLKESTQSYVEFGKSVSMPLSGMMALVGAPNYGAAPDEYDGPGCAFLYKYKDGTWQKSTVLTGTDANGFANQGEAVLISPDGTTAFVGGPGDNNNTGAVWVYDLTKSPPKQQAKLVPNDSGGEDGSRFGKSIASSKGGNRVVIGGESDDNNKGAVWIFERKKGKWSQSGSKIVPEGITGNYAGFGSSAAMTWDGATFVAGAPFDNNKGAAYVFELNSGLWVQKQKLTDSNAPQYGAFGMAVAIQVNNGAMVLASDPYVTASEQDQWRGRVITYTRKKSNKPYVEQAAIAANPCNELGRSLALSQNGDFLFAGSPQTMSGDTETGGTCFYTRQTSGSSPWSQFGPPIIAK